EVSRLYDNSIPLQKRVNDFNKNFESLFQEVNTKEGHTSNLKEREISTLLTYRYPEQYTFYLHSFYTPFVKCLGEMPAPAGEKLVDYYKRVEEFRKDVLPDYEDIIAVTNNLTEGENYYQ